MLRTVFLGALALFSATVVMATTPGATNTAGAKAIVTQALACDLAPGKADSVSKALQILTSTRGGAGTFTLRAPLSVSGLLVSQVQVDDQDGVDTYIAVLKSAAIADVAAKANLKPLAKSFVRDTKHGRLSADVRDQTDVWLTCTVTQ
jgi:hypothetical protein